MAGGVGLRHNHAAALDGGLQRILDSGGIGRKSRSQLVVEYIAGEVVDAVVGLVSVCGGQADGRQHGGAAITVVKAIQHTHLPLTIHQFIVHGDIGNTEVGELHALNGVLAQLVDNRIVMQAGGNVGFRIPRAIFAGCGDVILVDRKGCFLCRVDCRLCERCGDEAQSHNNGHEQREHAMDLFHVQFVSFLMLDFLQK